jgi:hypothetical protein
MSLGIIKTTQPPQIISAVQAENSGTLSPLGYGQTHCLNEQGRLCPRFFSSRTDLVPDFMLARDYKLIQLLPPIVRTRFRRQQASIIPEDKISYFAGKFHPLQDLESLPDESQVKTEKNLKLQHIETTITNHREEIWEILMLII